MKNSSFATIGDVCKFVGGSQPDKSHFKSVKGPDDIRLVQIRDYKTNSYKTYIPKVLAKRTCQEDDIMIGRYGPPIFQILRGIAGAYNVALIKAVPNEKVDKNYLFYYLSQKSIFRYIDMLSHRTGGQTGVDLTSLRNYPIFLPDKSDQLLISSILATLDSKINLNNKINAELENMAKLIYDYWFVQFDFPDENGNPYKSSGRKMLWSEELKREIPEGWNVGGLDDIGDVTGGSTPSRSNDRYFTKNGIAWITPKDLSLNLGKKFISKGETDITELGIKNASLNLLPKGTVLLTSRAPIGYMAISRNEVTTNQGFKSLVPKKLFSTEYVFYTVQIHIDAMIQYASGSTFSEISASTLKMIKIPIPNAKLVQDFTEKVESIFTQQNILEQENEQLEQLRDWLLPMLMNGQIKVVES